MSLAETASPPNLYQATIEVSAELAERIGEAVGDADHPAALAVAMFDWGGGRFEVSAYYAEQPEANALGAILDAVRPGGGLGAWRITPIVHEDWVTLSQGKRPPVRAGRFLVHGRHDRAPGRFNRTAIEIDAGQAFGTAHHATTRGCLIALDDLLQRRRFARVFDLGTGSGLLAIAAAKVLRRSVVASDADPIAVRVAVENAGKNGVGPWFRAVHGSGFGHASLRRMRADLILANLLERPLLRLAPEIARRLRPKGIAVLSGITAKQSATIEARYSSLGFCLKRRIIIDGWAILVLMRRNALQPRARD